MVANNNVGVEPVELAADGAMGGQGVVLSAGPEGRILYAK